ncbi:MAG: glycosyltransferase [Bacteroidia bacterium]|nr:glycosyltransferase [Bacteroidia bacterium]
MNNISVVTACMNRNDNLKKALESWVSISSLYEIIIVDWNSDINVYEDIKELIKGHNVKVFRVTGVKEWVLTTAFNLGFQKATGESVLKLDADIILQNSFFQHHTLLDGIFFSGNGKSADDDNQRYLNGIFYSKKTDIELVNGYNEYIRIYGYDDDDLYKRLIHQGLIKKEINKNLVYHIPHEKRHHLQSQFIELIDIPDRKVSWIKNLTNQYLVDNYYRWEKDSKKVTYQESEKDGYFELSPIDFEISAPDECHVKEAKEVALRMALSGNENLNENLIADFSSEDIFNLYKFLYNDDFIGDVSFIKQLRSLFRKINNRRVYLWKENKVLKEEK